MTRRPSPRTLTTLGAAAGALNTLNALRPLGYGRVERAIPSFMAGLPTSELPLQLIGAQALGCCDTGMAR